MTRRQAPQSSCADGCRLERRATGRLERQGGDEPSGLLSIDGRYRVEPQVVDGDLA
jgi:hypothetical protein